MPATITDDLIELLPRLRRFALSLCRSGSMADDLVQTACERALARADSFTPGTRFDSWMFRIVRNLWIDELRRRKREGPTEDIDEHYGLAGADRTGAAEARSDLKKVLDAIGDLRPDHREVLVLVCLEEMSYREVAEILKVPIGTVMSRLARARMKLAEISGIDPAADR